MLVGSPFTGAPEARLHLVEDEQDALFVAHLAQCPEVRRRDDVEAALPLHRLYNDGRHLGGRYVGLEKMVQQVYVLLGEGLFGEV